MKIRYDQCNNDVGVVVETERKPLDRFFFFNLRFSRSLEIANNALYNNVSFLLSTKKKKYFGGGARFSKSQLTFPVRRQILKSTHVE